MRRRLLDILVTRLTWLLIAFVGATTRKTWVNWHVVEALEARSEPLIYALWHNNLMYYGHVLRHKRLLAMISRSRDGEAIAWVLERFGFVPVRGSSASGSLAALRGALRGLREGRSLSITPDGPRGPRYVLQEGTVALAQKSGAPVIPLCFATRDCWEAGSWDRMKVPKPFRRVTIMAGDPVRIARDEDPAAARHRLEHAMRRLVAHADQFAGGNLTQREPLLADALDGASSGE